MLFVSHFLVTLQGIVLIHVTVKWIVTALKLYEQESVRPRWPYDMRPSGSVRAEKYIRDASGWRKDVTDGRQTDRQSATQYAAPS